MASLSLASRTTRVSPVCCSIPEAGAHAPPTHVAIPSVSAFPTLSISAKAPSCERLAIDPSAAYANIMWFKGTFNAQVDVGENEAPESVVRRFRKVVMEANVINECRRRKFYETPQDIRKRKFKDVVRARKRGRYSSRGGYNPTADVADTTVNVEDNSDNWGVNAE